MDNECGWTDAEKMDHVRQCACDDDVSKVPRVWEPGVSVTAMAKTRILPMADPLAAATPAASKQNPPPRDHAGVKIKEEGDVTKVEFRAKKRTKLAPLKSKLAEAAAVAVIEKNQIVPRPADEAPPTTTSPQGQAETCVGIAVAKDFGPEFGGVFYGQVTKVDTERKQANEDLFHVTWEDGDEEDLNGAELTVAQKEFDKWRARTITGTRVRKSNGR